LLQNELFYAERLYLPDFHISSPAGFAMKRPSENNNIARVMVLSGTPKGAQAKI
jgi:hypothetical protein